LIRIMEMLVDIMNILNCGVVAVRRDPGLAQR